MAIIKNVLIPKITYGIEIFGHRYSYLTEIKELINRAIGKAQRWPNFSRQAIYEELEIQQIEELGRYRQQKSLIDWQKSNGPIKALLLSNKYLKSHGNSKSIKRTWLNEASEWTKKNKIILTTKKDLKKQIKLQFNDKKRLNPDCKTQNFRIKHCLVSGLENLKRESNYRIEKGIKLVTEIRTGTHQNRLQLIGRGDIPHTFYSKCLICNEIAPDDYEHWTTNCISLENLRKQTIDNLTKIIKATEGDDWKVKLISIMLNSKTKFKCPIETLKKEQRHIDEFNSKLHDIGWKVIMEAKKSFRN
ncbi:hypothetical protein GINT2_000005 [Glugoides intestinalis]